MEVGASCIWSKRMSKGFELVDLVTQLVTNGEY